MILVMTLPEGGCRKKKRVVRVRTTNQTGVTAAAGLCATTYGGGKRRPPGVADHDDLARGPSTTEQGKKGTKDPWSADHDVRRIRKARSHVRTKTYEIAKIPDCNHSRRPPMMSASSRIRVVSHKNV